MPDLKLAKLPDRTPVKITITVQPELNAALRQYAEAYRATYGDAEAVSELIPFMLDAFLSSDRGFAKAQKDGLPTLPPNAEIRRHGRRASHQPASPTNTEE